MNENVFSWKESLAITYQEFSAQIISFAPQLIGALALLFLGWLVALVLRLVTRKLIRGFDSVFSRVIRSNAVRQDVLKRSYAKIVSRIVFWAVMIFFIAAAANMLGWSMFSNWMNSVVAYLPNLISGLLIILAGVLLGGVARAGILNAAYSAQLKQGELLARTTQIVILFTTLVVGIEQIGIDVSFLTNVLIVVIGVLLGGATLAFSFGAKTLVENIVAAQYVRKHCRIGEQMSIAEVEGSIVEVTQTSIVLETGSGRTVIPAKYFQEQVTRLSSPHKAPPQNDQTAGGDL